MRITVLGFDINGNLFLNKYFLFPETQPGINRFYGMNIDFDTPDSIVVAYFGDDNCSGSCNNYKVGLLKMDISGNVSFSKTYDFINSPQEYVKSLNITEDSYVLFGGYDFANLNSKLFALRLDKSGNYQTAKLISRTGKGFPITMSNVNTGGSSKFINNTHHFCSSIHDGNVNMRDMMLLQLDENLNSLNQCYTIEEVSVDELIIPPFSADLIVVNKIQNIAPNDNFSVTDYSINTNCTLSDIVYEINSSNCDSTVYSISSLSNTIYDITWSNGINGNTASFYSNTTAVVNFNNSADCCNFTDTINVQFPSIYPELNLQDDTVLCVALGESVEITPESVSNCSNCNYLWITGETTSSIQVQNSGNYILTVTNSCGESDTDSVEITINHFPVINLISDTLICSGDFPFDINLNSQFASNISWSTGETTDSISIYVPGSYTVEINNVCATIYDTIFIGEMLNPVISTLVDYSGCVDADSVVSFDVQCQYCNSLYVNGSITESFFVAANTDTTFLVYGYNQCGTDSTNFEVDLSYFPVMDLEDSIVVCPSDYPVLVQSTVSYTTNYLWSNGDTGQLALVNSSGYIKLEASNNCASIIDSTLIIEMPEPIIQPLADIDTCVNAGTTIDVYIEAFNYNSLFVNDVLSSVNFISCNSDTLIIIRTENNCSTDSVEFDIDMNYNVTMGLNVDTLVCEGDLPITYDVNVSYQDTIFWSNGLSGSETQINDFGNYLVTVANACNSIRDTISISPNEMPILYTPDNIDTCVVFGEEIHVFVTCDYCSDLTVNEQALLNNEIIAYEDRNYLIIGQNECGADTANLSLNMNYFPVNLLPDDTCISVYPAMFNLQPDNSSIFWDNTLDSTIIINSPGIHYYQIVNQCSQIFDSISFQLYPEIEITSQIDTCLVPDSGFYLPFSCNNCYYSYSNEIHIDSVFIDESGVYYISAANQCGSVTDSLEVAIRLSIDPVLPDTFFVCDNEFYIGDLFEDNNITYMIFNQNNMPIEDYIRNHGWYTVQYSNLCQNSSDQVYFDFRPEYSFFAPNSFTPDDDEFNNIFRFEGEVDKIFSVEIYNRWGQVVYKETDGFSGWDGTMNGNVCQDGLYIVKVNYIDCNGLDATLLLHVNLLR